MTDEEYTLPAPGTTVEVRIEMRVDGGVATNLLGTFPVHVEESRPVGPQDVPDARAMLTVSKRDIVDGLIAVLEHIVDGREEETP